MNDYDRIAYAIPYIDAHQPESKVRRRTSTAKQHFLSTTAAFVAVSFFLALATPQFECTGLSSIGADSQATQHVSYFSFCIQKRQWLADARTILACIRYLRESHVISCRQDDDITDPARTEDALPQSHAQGNRAAP
jgi:hypothetical protein